MNIWLELSLCVLVLAAFCGIVHWYDRPRPFIFVTEDCFETWPCWSLWLVRERRLGDSTKLCLGYYETEAEALRAASEKAREYGIHNGVDPDQS